MSSPMWESSQSDADMPVLRLLMGSPRKFLESTRLRQATVGRTALEADAAALVSPEELVSLISEGRPREPYISLMTDEGVVSPESYTHTITLPSGLPVTGVLEGTAAAKFLGPGTRIVLNAVDHYHPNVAELCTNLSRELNAPTAAVAWVMLGAGRRRQVCCSDAAETFVIQIGGTMEWQVYEQATGATRDAGRPCLEASLNPGDCLYVPWGFPHSVVNCESPSYCLLVSVWPSTWRDILTVLIRTALEPSHHDAAPFSDDTISPRFADDARVRAEAGIADVRESATEDFMAQYFAGRSRAAPARAGFIEQAAKSAKMSGDAIVSRNYKIQYKIWSDTDSSVRLRVGMTTFQYPAKVGEILAAVEARGRATISDLAAELGGAGLPTLVAHLVGQGILLLS